MSIGKWVTGVVEVDETFVGGKYDKRRKRAPWGKQAVAGVLECGKDGQPSKVRAFAIRTTSKAILTGVVRSNVAPDAEMLCTDQAPGYKSVGRGYRHEVVNHIAMEYARRTGESLITTNNVENFWSLFKRALVGQYHSVSVKHLTRYLDESTFKFNNRHEADQFGSTVSRMVNSSALPLAELTFDE